ncbi:ABC transporter ATP-binding protein, partial [Bacillus cereus]|nr:ABC transporter ATP-binding protein [Bacillus cereus]
PYTKGLLNSLPKISNGVKERLAPIQGVTPNLLNPPQGCPFAERCPHAMDICEKERPPYFEVGNERRSMCWLNDKTVGESHA